MFSMWYGVHTKNIFLYSQFMINVSIDLYMIFILTDDSNDLFVSVNMQANRQ